MSRYMLTAEPHTPGAGELAYLSRRRPGIQTLVDQYVPADVDAKLPEAKRRELARWFWVCRGCGCSGVDLPTRATAHYARLEHLKRCSGETPGWIVDQIVAFAPGYEASIGRPNPWRIGQGEGARERELHKLERGG